MLSLLGSRGPETFRALMTVTRERSSHFLQSLGKSRFGMSFAMRLVGYAKLGTVLLSNTHYYQKNTFNRLKDLSLHISFSTAFYYTYQTFICVTIYADKL